MYTCRYCISYSPIRLAYKGFLLGSKYTGILCRGANAPGSPGNRVLLTNPRLKCNRREIGAVGSAHAQLAHAQLGCILQFALSKCLTQAVPGKAEPVKAKTVKSCCRFRHCLKRHNLRSSEAICLMCLVNSLHRVS